MKILSFRYFSLLLTLNLIQIKVLSLTNINNFGVLYIFRHTNYYPSYFDLMNYNFVTTYGRFSISYSTF